MKTLKFASEIYWPLMIISMFANQANDQFLSVLYSKSKSSNPKHAILIFEASEEMASSLYQNKTNGEKLVGVKVLPPSFPL